MVRKIIHIDADCFFAAVEIRDNPNLARRPIAVGGCPGGRGVVCTASYEARKFGVRSAMPSAQAKRLCPDLIFLSPDMARYRLASQAMREVFARFTDTVEPLSLDEAFLDVSGSHQCSGSATWIASQIQQAVRREVGLSVSAGVAPVKFVAKIASDWQKPQGLYVVEPDALERFCARLPVDKLPGVGRVTQTRLAKVGIYDCADLRGFGEHALVQTFGRFGKQLYEWAWGRDDRDVQSDRVRKTLSVERTYSDDLLVGALSQAAGPLANDLKRRYGNLKHGYQPIKQFVKLKFADFSQTVLETTLPASAIWPPTSYFERLLHLAWHRHKKPVRLVGLGVRLKPNESPASGAAAQLCLF